MILKDLRVNERIRAREVRLIDENGSQVGIVPLREALEFARSKGLDLIEVAANANPPVCRVMDYGKFKYEQSKREREVQRKQRMSEMKGIRLRPKTDEHDLQFKINNTIKFLKQGHKVKVTVIFRSREYTHPEFAEKALQQMVDAVVGAGVGTVERPAQMEGRMMTMVLAPVAERKGAPRKTQGEQPGEESS
ncbi:MAG: translation initiation factor IF-3 [Armatimonadota bacterium]|nr:translation initiation factor IF-3 [Armatimonadota bacterium]